MTGSNVREAEKKSPPVEPILEMSEIQGIAVPGFLKPYQCLLYVRYTANGHVIAQFKKFLETLKISTAAETLADRRQFRAAKRDSEQRRESNMHILTAIGFTYQGLSKLTASAFYIRSEAFRQGLATRSALLGDPQDENSEGHPTNWTVGRTGEELDALIVLAGGVKDNVVDRGKEIAAQLQAIGVDVKLEKGGIREDARGKEHFGFDDGVSQPAIRGMASTLSDDFIIERPIEDVPAAWLYANPGQELVWPGHFVLGYPCASADPLIPGPESEVSPEWTKNGSFLVYRKLRQDVGLFWRALKAEAERLSDMPGFENMTDDKLAAMLVGRWPSGAPVNRTPEKDDSDLGNATYANNNFRFDSDTPTYKLKDKTEDIFPTAKADPAGITCPWASHIKKLNVRDSGSDMGGASATHERRILRVGIPYGESLKDRYADTAQDPLQGDRGLLFLCIQASIEEQFEFLQSRWMNDPTRPKAPGGHDMIVGQNAATPDGIRRCTLFGGGLAQAEVRADKQFVIPVGGGYFFLPSMKALSEVLSK